MDLNGGYAQLQTVLNSCSQVYLRNTMRQMGPADAGDALRVVARQLPDVVIGIVARLLVVDVHGIVRGGHAVRDMPQPVVGKVAARVQLVMVDHAVHAWLVGCAVALVAQDVLRFFATNTSGTRGGHFLHLGSFVCPKLKQDGQLHPSCKRFLKIR